MSNSSESASGRLFFHPSHESNPQCTQNNYFCARVFAVPAKSSDRKYSRFADGISFAMQQTTRFGYFQGPSGTLADFQISH
jgi:hypothetical protein